MNRLASDLHALKMTGADVALSSSAQRLISQCAIRLSTPSMSDSVPAPRFALCHWCRRSFLESELHVIEVLYTARFNTTSGSPGTPYKRCAYDIIDICGACLEDKFDEDCYTDVD